MNVDEVFLRAQEKKTQAEREAFLDGACGTNLELRKRVEALLASHEAAGSFLEQPLFNDAATQAPAITEQAGAVIGPYKLLQQIGEGGFGVVFMAEQQEPVVRKVALKIIKPGMDTKEVVARFEAERQALAIMDHQNIARVFDGGTTESGRPYFVMELVRGLPITEFADKNDLTTVERLQLFTSVCQAVQHAHHKGVIHRDIKPSNVLVTLHDGKPLVKVIDFGVAKAIHQRLTDKTLFTNFLQMIGTPLYMSPEQAELSSLDIDTRTDVYSLGVLLYELLVGTTPFDKERLQKAAYEEMRRIIREEEPLRPSNRISTLGETLTDICTHRRTEPRNLSRIVQGDLDWIVMKALEKDRSRRYETAKDLAEDIQRHLSHAPVLASPPSRIYRLRKLARRNKLALSVGSILAMALVLGLTGTTWQAIRATNAERIAVKERDRAMDLQRETELQRQRAKEGEAQAEKSARDAAIALQIVANALGTTSPSQFRDVAGGTANALDELLVRLDADEMHNKHAEANIRYTMGRSYHTFGEKEKARAQLERALELNEQIYGTCHEKVADTLHWLAIVTPGNRATANDAEKYARRALAIRTQLAKDGRSGKVANSLGQVGRSLQQQGKPKEALTFLEDALQMNIQFWGPDSSVTAYSLWHISECYCDLGDINKQIEYENRSAEMFQRSGNADGQWLVSMALARTLQAQQKWSGARDAFQRALDVADTQSDLHGERTLEALHGLARLFIDQQDFDRAKSTLERALAIAEQYGEDKSFTWRELAALYKSQKDWDAAEKAFDNALAACESLETQDHNGTLQALSSLADLHASRGHFQRQQSTLKRALSVAEQNGVDRLPSLLKLADCLRKQGFVDQTNDTYRQALDVARSAEGDTYPRVKQVLVAFAEAQDTFRDYEQKLQVLAELHSLAAKQGAAGLQRTYWSQLHRALTLDRLGRDSEVQDRLRDLLSELKQVVGSGDVLFGNHMDRIGIAYLIERTSTDPAELHHACQLTKDVMEQRGKGDHLYVQLCNCILGSIYNALGDHEQAAECARQTIELTASKLIVDRWDSDSLIIDILVDAGCEDEAHQFMLTRIDQAIRELGDEHLLVAYAHQDLASLAINCEKLQAADEAIEEAHDRLWHRSDIPSGRKSELATSAIELYVTLGEQETIQLWQDRLLEWDSEPSQVGTDVFGK